MLFRARISRPLRALRGSEHGTRLVGSAGRVAHSVGARVSPPLAAVEREQVEAEAAARFRVALLVEHDRLNLEPGGDDRPDVLALGGLQEQEPGGPEDAMQLPEGARDIWHDVEHVRAEHRVVGRRRQFERLHVHEPVGEVVVDVDREPRSRAGPVAVDDATLGADVEDVSRDRARVAVEPEAELAMALVGAAAGAVQAGIGDEAAEAASARSAVHAVPAQGERNDLEGQRRRERSDAPGNGLPGDHAARDATRGQDSPGPRRRLPSARATATRADKSNGDLVSGPSHGGPPLSCSPSSSCTTRSPTHRCRVSTRRSTSRTLACSSRSGTSRPPPTCGTTTRPPASFSSPGRQWSSGTGSASPSPTASASC